MTLSNNVRKVREYRGMDIDRLAMLTGLPASKIVSFDTQMEDPSAEQGYLLSQALQVDMEYICNRVKRNYIVDKDISYFYENGALAGMGGTRRIVLPRDVDFTRIGLLLSGGRLFAVDKEFSEDGAYIIRQQSKDLLARRVKGAFRDDDGIILGVPELRIIGEVDDVDTLYERMLDQIRNGKGED